jgi:hypothetical protein
MALIAQTDTINRKHPLDKSAQVLENGYQHPHHVDNSHRRHAALLSKCHDVIP